MNLEQLYQPITVDLWNPYPLPKMHVQQNNIGRVALVTLTAGGTVVDPSSYSVTAWATKPDMTVSYAMCEVTNGKVTLGFTSQMLAVSGELKVEIRLIADGVDISTPIFIVCVGKSNISNSAIESQNEFTVFQQVLNEVNQLSKEIEDLKANDTNTEIDEAVANYLAENPVSGGLTTTAKNLLITILRNALYSTDQSVNITSLENALGQSSSDTTVYYVVSNSLTNVTSNNMNTSVLENSSYIATLTADTGYALDSVVVTMGNEDVTSTVYADGVITIASVTGNITITANAVESSASGGDTSTAELPTDGLQAYFDFRNVEWTDGGGNPSYISSVTGNKRMIDWHAQTSVGTEYGLEVSGYYCDESNTTTIDCGTEFTWLFHSYGNCICGAYDYFSGNITTPFNINPAYNTSSGTSKITYEPWGDTTDKVARYRNIAMVVNAETLKLYIDGVLFKTYIGTDYDDFVSWVSKLRVGCFNSQLATAWAVYDKALSETEITDSLAFFKTLEVA